MRKSIIDANFQSTNPKIQEFGPEMIRHVPEEDKTLLIQKGLASAYPKTQEACAWMIRQAPMEERFLLLKIGLRHQNPEVQRTCAWIVSSEELRQHILSQELAKLVQIGLESPYPEVQKLCASIISYTPADAREELFSQAFEKLGNYLIEGPLYKNTDISSDIFLQRRAFKKSGSETTLVGGNLKGTTIVRHIESGAFLNWQKLYDAHEAWEEAGFDYVPIEPIQSYRLNKHNLVDVSSGVLDLNVKQWGQMSDRFYYELKEDRSRIMSVLATQGITHGHDHDLNFCLRFFRDANGKADLTQKPRLYLIDFDQAISPVS